MMNTVILVLVLLAIVAMGVLSALGRTPDSRSLSRDYGVGALLSREGDRR